MIKGHVETFGFGFSNTYEHMSSLMTYAFNMPIFFFISGYFAYKESQSSQGIFKQLWRKFIFLVVPAITFYMFYSYVNGTPLLGFIRNGLGRYWFTFTLYICFVCYYLARIASTSKYLQITILSAISVFGIGYLCVFSKIETGLLDLNHFAKYFQYFAIGIIAKMYNDRYLRIITNQKLITFSTICFFILLVALFQCDMPAFIYQALRDLALRYLATFMIISLFFCKRQVFDGDNRINRIILLIGRYSLPIYLLQYFFLPDLHPFFNILDNVDMLTIQMLSIVYSMVITVFCLMIMWVLSNSDVIKKYFLGQTNIQNMHMQINDYECDNAAELSLNENFVTVR